MRPSGSGRGGICYGSLPDAQCGSRRPHRRCVNHLSMKVVSSAFSGLSRIKQHQLVLMWRRFASELAAKPSIPALRRAPQPETPPIPLHPQSDHRG